MDVIREAGCLGALGGWLNVRDTTTLLQLGYIVLLR
jgi:hypothetical protein